VAGSAAPPEPTRSQEHARAVARLTSLFEVSQSARPVFLLGAGASYRSGVPPAADATHRIAREAYARQRLGTNAVATVKPSAFRASRRRSASVKRRLRPPTLLKHAVLLLEILDHVQLTAVNPTGEHQEEHLKSQK
jgi:hypothetical protein